ncbi:unnamed protein product [Spirodela intermedia]|uniref:Uncharacterized protein n=2 Tax=Spirodela intermedia TaxID=51605 RepID=A0A7I8JPQ6_SPIIN|nr:unnamed protein product [Spirodela intermedia]CAA6672144.1 unnamed protein product [Spirodela intermedia]CAA7409290.1 unnamed protein product [Spirodela intermedia]
MYLCLNSMMVKISQGYNFLDLLLVIRLFQVFSMYI